MTVIMYCHCEEERRSNPVKNNALNRFNSMERQRSMRSGEICN